MNYNIYGNPPFVVNVRLKFFDLTMEIPKYATQGASGLDLYTKHTIVLPPHRFTMIPTGIGIELPAGLEGQIRPRSSFSKRGLHVPFGTIDSDYRGEIMVSVWNYSLEDAYIEAGNRVAQLVICPVFKIEWCVVEELSHTKRGEGGHGSTGR